MLPGKLLYEVEYPDNYWHFGEKSEIPDVFPYIVQYSQQSWESWQSGHHIKGKGEVTF